MNNYKIIFGLDGSTQNVVISKASWSAIERMAPIPFEYRPVSRRDQRLRADIRGETAWGRNFRWTVTAGMFMHWFGSICHFAIVSGITNYKVTQPFDQFEFLPHENPTEIFHDLFKLLRLASCEVGTRVMVMQEVP